jgi:hypothetical protein
MMRLQTVTNSAIALALAVVAAPALGQAVGMQVVDTSGAPVGTVTAIRGDNVQIKTDKHDALLPKASFRVDQGKLIFGMTQAQLDTQVEAAAAASQKAIVAGATVNGSAGTAIGKIDAVDNGQVTMTLTSGKRIAVPITGLRGNADGTVTIGYTADQIEALTSGSGGTPASTTPGGSTAGK